MTTSSIVQGIVRGYVWDEQLVTTESQKQRYRRHSLPSTEMQPGRSGSKRNKSELAAGNSITTLHHAIVLIHSDKVWESLPESLEVVKDRNHDGRAKDWVDRSPLTLALDSVPPCPRCKYTVDSVAATEPALKWEDALRLHACGYRASSRTAAAAVRRPAAARAQTKPQRPEWEVSGALCESGNLRKGKD